MYTVALQPQVHGGACITMPRQTSTSLLVTTDEHRWSFAASFPLCGFTKLEGLGLRAVVDIEVQAGAIGIGCTPADFSSYVDRELTVSSGARRKVYVPIGAPEAAAYLVLRNVSSHGGSQAQIHSIQICHVSAREEIAEQLRISGPIGAAVPHGACVVEAFGERVSPPGFQPVVIETDVEVYSNAGSFALIMPLDLDAMARTALIVDLHVEAGAVWIGCTTADYAAYVDREVYVPAGMRRKVYVPLGSSRSAAHAMFRNDSLDGRSVLRVYGMEIRSVTAAEDLESHLKSLSAVCLDIHPDEEISKAFNTNAHTPIRQSQGFGDTKGTNIKVFGKTASRVGGMATMPSRARTFEIVLERILPQLDRLYLYFDKHSAVPPGLANHPKIVPLLPSQYGEWGACGKFLGSRLHQEPCLYFCFDDDILYPHDYVQVMTDALYRHELQAVVGVHGSLLKPPYSSYSRDRDVVEFRKPLAVDCCFDLLGTGTIAFHTGVFQFDPGTWRYHDMADLMVAIEAAKVGLPRIAVRRPKNYLQPLERQQPDSIYVRLVSDDTRETAIMRQALRSCSLCWSFSPVAIFDKLDAGSQDPRYPFINTTHGVIASLDDNLCTHTGLADLDRFVAHLGAREHPYVPIAACLRGEGDALTIDDSTRAGLQAARLAREYGHAVTLFLNGYNISQNIPYHFSRLNAALDDTKVESIYYEGYVHDLRTTVAKQRFRSLLKKRIAQLGSDLDRQNLVTEIAVMLAVDEIVVPGWLQPISCADVKDLAAEGVDIENHGWTHVLVGALSPAEYQADIRRGREWLFEVCGAKAEYFAVPNGDGLPLSDTSTDYKAWLLLDQRRPPGELAPGVFNRRMLSV